MVLDSMKGKEVVVDCCGSLFYTRYTVKKFYMCPLCENTIFFTERDLVNHLKSHALGSLKRRHKIPRR